MARRESDLMIMKNLADILMESGEIDVDQNQNIAVLEADRRRLVESGWIPVMKRIAVAAAAKNADEEDMTLDSFVTPTNEILMNANPAAFEGYRAYAKMIDLKLKDREVQYNLQEAMAKTNISLGGAFEDEEEQNLSPEAALKHKQCVAQAKHAMRLMPFLKVGTADEDTFWRSSAIEINSILDGSYGTGPVPAQVEER